MSRGGRVHGRLTAAPGFGEADLTNCEREAIHLAASIQPFGALLAIRESDGTVVQTSADAAEFLGLDGPLLGQPAETLGDLWLQLRPHLDGPRLASPSVVRCRLGREAAAFDGLLHHPPGGGLIVELERAGPPVDLSHSLAPALKAIVTAGSVRELCDETARIYERLTGYDRVMVYRFDEDGHGEVFSEQRRAELEAYLGNRYPASDIPQMARRLYERNRVRVLADVGYQPVPLVPRLSPATGEDLDMSLCFLRSMSPIHVQYLKNMGVAATLVVSLVVGGRLWGLVACHHYAPRFVHFEVRATCELLAETVATRIAALESFAQGQAELAVRRLEHRMSEATRREGDWRIALFDGSLSLLAPMGATGAALLFEGQVLTAGEVPSTQRVRELGVWLDRQPGQPVLHTARLSLDAPGFAPIAGVASGLLAAPVSNSPGEYLMWFRPEVVSTVTWGGNPFKPASGDTPADLSPRRSFAQWHQQVEGTAEKWTQANIAAARLIGESVTDVVLQFRSVRMLIAQDQLEQVVRQLRVSAQPVLIADAAGRVLLSNAAFAALRPGAAAPATLDELPGWFVDPPELSRRLAELRADGRHWRGEVRVDQGQAGTTSLLVRCDPVSTSPERVLGYVLLFTDLTARHAADAARQRFQEGIVQGHRLPPAPLDPRAASMLQALLASVVENAQLAGLEITDGLDLARMPDLLDSVQDSVGRAAAVLQHLIGHADVTNGGH